MREMKDSGVPWIGEIPKGWEVAPLWRTLRRRTEIGHPEEVVLSLYRDLGIVPKDSRDDNHNVTSLDTSSYKFVRVGDFVINKMKAWQGSMAVSAYQGIVSPAYHVCEFISERVYPRYLHYLLRNPSYLPEYGRLSSGLRVGQWDLSYDDFKLIPHLIPSLVEQQRIVDFLDAKCEEIDSVLGKTRASIEEYKKLKQSVITEAVTKGIRGERPMKDSGVEWIREIPVEWEAKAIKYCFRVVSGGTPNTNVPSFWDGDIPWITPADFKTEDHYVSSGKRSLTTKGLESCNAIMVPNGSVVFSKRAPIGTVAISINELCTNQGCLVCIPKKAFSEFFYFAFTAFKEVFELNGSGTTFKEISITSFVNFRVPVPPIDEQKEIVAYLDEKCTAIDSLIASKEALITELEAYKKSLIYEYVTGKKEVL